MMKAIIVEVKDPITGEVLDRREFNTDLLREYLARRSDLGTDNFGKLLKAIFTPVEAGGSVSSSLVDVDGNSRGVDIKKHLGTDTCFWNSYQTALHVQIRVGDSSVAPSRDQYNLRGTELGRANVSVSYADGYVNITASFSWDTDQVVYEFGLFIKSGYGRAYFFMLDRTVVSDGISVPAGKVLTITYQISI